jgi:2'-5' RNA ligase
MTQLRRHDDPGQLVFHRLFFALRPTEDAIEEIGAIRDMIGPVRTRMLDHRLHMTLFPLDLPFTPSTELVRDVIEAASALSGPPLRIALQEAVSNGDHVVLRPGDHMPVLKGFQEKLGLAMAAVPGWTRRGYRFDPHVTIAYGARETYRKQIWPISWRADEIVLIHSLLGLTEHRVLARWSLGD